MGNLTAVNPSVTNYWEVDTYLRSKPLVENVYHFFFKWKVKKNIEVVFYKTSQSNNWTFAINWSPIPYFFKRKEEAKEKLKKEMKKLGFKDDTEIDKKEIKNKKKLNLEGYLNFFEEIVELGYEHSEEITRAWHNKHNDLNWIDSLEIIFKKIKNNEKELKKYLEELKKEIKENKGDSKYINTLFKRVYEEIDSLYFWNKETKEYRVFYIDEGEEKDSKFKAKSDREALLKVLGNIENPEETDLEEVKEDYDIDIINEKISEIKALLEDEYHEEIYLLKIENPKGKVIFEQEE